MEFWVELSGKTKSSAKVEVAKRLVLTNTVLISSSFMSFYFGWRSYQLSFIYAWWGYFFPRCQWNRAISPSKPPFNSGQNTVTSLHVRVMKVSSKSIAYDLLYI